MTDQQKAVSVRVERMNRNEYRHQRAHDTRTTVPGYAYAERVHLNRVLVEYPDTDLMVEGIQASRRNRHRRGETQRAPRTLRKDGVLGVKGILTFSHDAQPIIQGLSNAEQDRLYRKAANAVAAEFNASVVGLVVHADEQAPHAHFILPGFDQKGEPLSERMTDSMYTRLQDVVGAAYNEIGIERGIRKVDRLKAGEPDSKTIHRSVQQLHADLPAEIEAAQEVIAEAREQADAARTEAADAEAERERARERAEEAQAELQALEEKIAKNERLESRAREQAEKAEAEGSERAAKARKKEQTYQKRAEKARVRYDEIMAEPPLPEPRREKIVTQDRGALRQPETKLVRVYPANEIEQYTAHTDMLRKKTEDNNRALRKRLKTLEDASNNWSHAGPDTQVSWSPEKALTARQEHRYGVICSTQDNEIAVPPQNATPKQVASAIYRYGKEQGWPSLVLDAGANIEREVLRMAKEDNRLESVKGVGDEVRREFKSLHATIPDMATAKAKHQGPGEENEPPSAGATY